MFFPNNSGLPTLLGKYLKMAADYVILLSPSTKYGRLGNLNPNVYLS
jgi:hypothetical protein